MPHNPALISCPQCAYKTRRRLAPPLPVGKPAVRPAPAGWEPGGTPHPCRLGNRRYSPPLLVENPAVRPTPAGWETGGTAHPWLASRLCEALLRAEPLMPAFILPLQGGTNRSAQYQNHNPQSEPCQENPLHCIGLRIDGEKRPMICIITIQQGIPA